MPTHAITVDGNPADPNTGDAPSIAPKVYVAKLSQSDATAAPTAAILENTIGNIIWTRDSGGRYFGTLAGAFTPGKTICPPFMGVNTVVGLNYSTPFDFCFSIDCNRTNDGGVGIGDIIELYVMEGVNGVSVDLFDAAFTYPILIEIRVYQ